MQKLNKDEAHKLFEYKDGDLIWKTHYHPTRYVGKKVGHIDSLGYVKTAINGKSIRVHQIVFLMHHGYIPELIDHIDRDKANNKIENLREATKSENLANSKIRSDSASGYKNVNWNSQKNRWQVKFEKFGKVKHYGYFNDVHEAGKIAINLQVIIK